MSRYDIKEKFIGIRDSATMRILQALVATSLKTTLAGMRCNIRRISGIHEGEMFIRTKNLAPKNKDFLRKLNITKASIFEDENALLLKSVNTKK